MNSPDTMQPNVTSLDDDAGLSLYDPIETAQFELYTADAVQPRPADSDAFSFPVETAVAVETTDLVVPKRDAIHVRTLDGGYCWKFHGQDGERRTADGDRLLELTSTAMKVYLIVPGPFEIRSDQDGRDVVVSLPGPGELLVGVRSFHERPAHTIETPAEPEAVMRALSATGSALKTLSPERSFPTLRGHPPAFEIADELSIPDEVSPPSTDVTIWVPPTWEFVYPVAPLVHYLGATLRPSGPPSIEVDGWSYSLGGPGVPPEDFQRNVSRALQQVFFMDCVTRTEGFYPIDLHERRALVDELDLDLATLYDEPLSSRVRTFLDVPHEVVEPHLPTWHLSVDVEPTGDHVTALPYLLDDLALLRCPTPLEPSEPDPELNDAIEEFSRTNGRTESPAETAGDSSGETFVRSARDTPTRSVVRTGEFGPESLDPAEDMVSLAPTSAMEQAYLGEGLPYRRNKLSSETLQRRLTYEEPTDDDITVTIVCNDERMADETAVEDYYGVHDLVEYDVEVAHDLTHAELTEVLRTDVDLLHYVGHVDDRGFTCADEPLDARNLDEVGVDAFLLNACNSYDQGQALLAAGATAGVTSLAEVGNRLATSLGRTMARALNAGFTLRSAFALAGLDTPANNYVVLGDGGRQLVQCQSGEPILVDIIDADRDAGTVTVDLCTFPASSDKQGTFCSPSLTDHADEYLTFGHLDSFTVTTDEFVDYLSTQPFPVTANGRLHWSNELDRKKLTTVLDEIADLRAVGRTSRRVTDFFRPLRRED